ncbi:signal peptidase complex subunit 1 [Hydra vulgaris]|uniref:Signal peptidase complex subunit 1 n=1 Tax=Hydra vulgaris TaxID=6087 RepID=T2M2I4_HYDVU|nr:signal peptidase complex subunit 1 [Hydra vulgaris]XP_047138419.1 signal peptidase complex subunit 1 [Hydra vulgaris]
MDIIKDLLFSLPFIQRVYDYGASFETHMDYEGQKKAERVYQVILTIFGVVGFLWGFYIQQLSATVYIVLTGFALSCLIVLPPWPFFRKNPLQWQPVVNGSKQTKTQKKNDSKKVKK